MSLKYNNLQEMADVIMLNHRVTSHGSRTSTYETPEGEASCLTLDVPVSYEEASKMNFELAFLYATSNLPIDDFNSIDHIIRFVGTHNELVTRKESVR